ncbi:hypothetical protein COY51_01020 [Candidatus Desantisbacteria bacterium CG_4_10_14_0_8_um_filter_39_17]|uniref:MrpA C-terminal/MbhD domain-containing protein n=1 Tax=Candidatus Desantisbacteria bacterium CG_4_10_14_0_8_um_filter_39_17 TaxID=1974542 RepID=A0A2H9PCT7_9BACT|nr:MAG: hypothetical protein COY51_01020 [Candidatus Desantisbacteria bacterium CG_4_10_14_0_8_um_filter_39_17]
MIESFLIILLISAVISLELKDLLCSVITLALFSLFLAATFYYLQAPDVAIAEAAIGAGLSTVIFILAISKTVRKDE